MQPAVDLLRKSKYRTAAFLVVGAMHREPQIISPPLRCADTKAQISGNLLP
jgi:hypothetical protein